MDVRALKAAFPHTTPVMAGYVFLGIAFGLIMISEGAELWVPVVMSLLICSGALEFAAVPFFFMPPDYIGMFFFGLMLNIRHTFYGIPMLEKYADMGKLKPLMIFWLTDETFTISSTIEPPEGVDRNRFYIWISALDYSYWIIGTALGAVCGNLVPFDLAGLDFALTALFIVLFLEQFKGREGVFGGSFGFVLTALSLIVVGKDKMIPLAMVLILAGLLLGRKWIEPTTGSDNGSAANDCSSCGKSEVCDE